MYSQNERNLKYKEITSKTYCTSSEEPINDVCDVNCERAEGEIKCPDKGYSSLYCPKYVTIYKQPHYVTSCQAPKTECETLYEEPRCDWKVQKLECHKQGCPKPKGELACENRIDLNSDKYMR